MACSMTRFVNVRDTISENIVGDVALVLLCTPKKNVPCLCLNGSTQPLCPGLVHGFAQSNQAMWMHSRGRRFGSLVCVFLCIALLFTGAGTIVSNVRPFQISETFAPDIVHSH